MVTLKNGSGKVGHKLIGTQITYKRPGINNKIGKYKYIAWWMSIFAITWKGGVASWFFPRFLMIVAQEFTFYLVQICCEFSAHKVLVISKLFLELDRIYLHKKVLEKLF